MHLPLWLSSLLRERERGWNVHICLHVVCMSIEYCAASIDLSIYDACVAA
jgi:hypothetical protein